MKFGRGVRVGEWVAFVVLALFVGGFIYSCSRHGL
jgi:hypothetical protein